MIGPGRIPWVSGGVVLLAMLLPGCARERDELRQALQQPPPASAASDRYLIACPDVLRVQVANRPELSGQQPVQINGCIDLEALDGVRVAGRTVGDAAGAIARLAGVPPRDVQVQVEQHLSKQVYLFGEVTGQQRAVPYEGPERVVDLLRRTGGITAAAAPEEVKVVRNPHLGRAEPEVLQVNLRAILLEGDERTNVTLEPFDQIFVPDTKQARVGRCLHPWLRPLSYFMPCRW